MLLSNRDASFWLQDNLEKGNTDLEKLRSSYDIVIVGAGISGISAAYWLLLKSDYNILILDHSPDQGATNRNCGHILHGTVENIQTMVSLYGRGEAKKLWDFSRRACSQVQETIYELGLNCDYHQDGYLVVALTEAEDKEVKGAIDILESFGYDNQEYLKTSDLAKLGLKESISARLELDSARANPVKFRNGLLKHIKQTYTNRFFYCDHAQVSDIKEDEHGCTVTLKNNSTIQAEATILATNAYTKLICDYVQNASLVEPFRGQIMVTTPLKKPLKTQMAHSFDHGYIYAVGTVDNRLMIGGWRNHTQGETGTYSLTLNPSIENGLDAFVRKHYDINQKDLRWDFGWTGIMGTAKGGLPLLGPTDNQRTFLCSGFTGHGFSWAHGSAKFCVESLLGCLDEADRDLAHHFNPKLR